MDRVDSERHDRRQRLAARFGAAVVFVHSATRMQRNAEAIATLQHQPMKPGRIDAGLRVASADLTGGDIGSGIDSEVGGDRQSGEVHGISFDHLVLPRRARNALDRAIILTALAKGCSERAWLHPQGSSYKPPIAGDVGDDRVSRFEGLKSHVAAAPIGGHDRGPRR